jgi:hypothetical protein
VDDAELADSFRTARLIFSKKRSSLRWFRCSRMDLQAVSPTGRQRAEARRGHVPFDFLGYTVAQQDTATNPAGVRPDPKYYVAGHR